MQRGERRDAQREGQPLLGQLVDVPLYSHLTWLPKYKENS